MEITKVKDNQILLEDDAFKEISDYSLKVVKSKTGLSDSVYDKEYDAFILAFRQPGMEASKQLFLGSTISLITLLSSMMHNLIDQELITEDLLEDMVHSIKTFRATEKK